ncbi:MAG: homoserine kinase [Chitinophagales bacterium]
MVTAYAPASIANVSCGFDVLGLAVDAPGDEVSVQFNDIGEVRIVEITGDDGKLPFEVEKNTASKAVLSLVNHLQYKKGIDIIIHKKMPFGSGLGSSAASAVAAVVAANHLMGMPLTKKELVDFAIDGEAVASGAHHADNVAPCLLGGIVLIRAYNPLDIIELPVPENLYTTVVHPHVEILTKEARGILPKEVSMKAAITQTGNLAGFIAGLYQDDLALLGRSMVDILAEPYRSSLIPEFQNVRNAAMYAGAFAFGISGSGPSMFAFSDNASKAEQVADLMEKTLTTKGIDCKVYVSKINKKGASVMW